MPGRADMSGGVVPLPPDYQRHGPQGQQVGDMPTDEWPEDSEEMAQFRAVEEMEALEVATIENWLLDTTPVEKWVRLRTKPLKVKLQAVTEETRAEIERKAPKILNKRTRQMEKDGNWVNLELVRVALVEPQVHDRDLLKKSLAGDLAYLAKQIGIISGFEDMDESDALG